MIARLNASRWLVTAVVVLVLGDVVAACNVPVFRYALERWKPESYEVFVFHEGPLSDADKKWTGAILDFAEGEDCPTNFTFELVDVSKKMSPALDKLYRKQKASSLPWMVVRYPEVVDADVLLHEGPADAAVFRHLIDSPVRRQIATRLLAGETAVWLFLESGDKSADDAKVAWLRGQLDKLQGTLKLPELTDSPTDKLLAEVRLKLEFGILRLARTDAQETELVRMLLHLEDDLAGRKEFMVFPIIGRGMALPTLVGAGINEDNVVFAARYIAGPCSCEAKRQNPGVDLLMTAAWEESLTGRLTKSPELPPLTSLVTAPSPAEASALAPGSVEGSSPSLSSRAAAPTNYRLWRNVVIAFGGLALLGMVGAMFLLGRKKN